MLQDSNGCHDGGTNDDSRHNGGSLMRVNNSSNNDKDTLHGVERDKQSLPQLSSGSDGSGGGGVVVHDDHSKLLTEIHQYLLGQPRYRASSQALVKSFQTKIDSSKSNLFRQFLKSIATLQSDGASGIKMWTLREEFI